MQDNKKEIKTDQINWMRFQKTKVLKEIKMSQCIFLNAALSDVNV